MRHFLRALSMAGLSAAVLIAGNPASAQKPGGILRVYLTASPPNMSMLELATIVGEMPMMGVFNNLLMFDQHVRQVSLQSIVPDLASEWAWNEDGTELRFKLRHGSNGTTANLSPPPMSSALGI
jgi:peptide/nickel transport system substrate-binding protein